MITTVMVFVAALLAGVFAWTFLEYALHNWLGHLGKGRNHFSREHLRHHREGDYFTPVAQKLAATLAALGISLPLGWLLLGPLAGITFSVGLVGMYVTYEVAHHLSHHHAPRTRYGRWVRKHHFAHHFTSAKMNHGVTSPIWDRVFGTYQSVERIRVPRKLALAWLIDPRTGEVRDEFSADYVLVGKRS